MARRSRRLCNGELKMLTAAAPPGLLWERYTYAIDVGGTFTFTLPTDGSASGQDHPSAPVSSPIATTSVSPPTTPRQGRRNMALQPNDKSISPHNSGIIASGLRRASEKKNDKGTSADMQTTAARCRTADVTKPHRFKGKRAIIYRRSARQIGLV